MGKSTFFEFFSKIFVGKVIIVSSDKIRRDLIDKEKRKVL
jgi:hypothetical protein